MTVLNPDQGKGKVTYQDVLDAGYDAEEVENSIPPEEPEPTGDPYLDWLQNPTQTNLAQVTRKLKPTIDATLASMNAVGNPQLRSRARVVTAKAIQTYDPTAGATLPTWVSSQLRQLARDNRKSNNIIQIPEGIQLDGYTIYKAEQEFMDRNDREPTVQELADLSHLPVKRIEQVRKKMKAVIADDASLSEDGSETSSLSEPDFSKDALDYVYNDSDTTDKMLLERITGYGGHEMQDSKAIMKELKLTPVQLSRRKARLSMRVRNIIDDFEQLNG